MKGLAIIMLSAFLAGSSFGYDERPVVPSGVPVQVRCQIKSVNSNSWSTNTATLKGSVSESMMVNELSRRHPNSQIRVLAAACGKNISTVVRYQTSRDGKSWNTGTVTLNNALTESMARNQLSQKFPNRQIRILGFSSR